MKRLFPLLLLLGALLGLVGQGSAFAQAMPVKQAEQTASAPRMSAECAEMMGLGKQITQPESRHSDKPCQGMTPDCVAKMGCAVQPALIPPFLGAAPGKFGAATPSALPIAPLVGRDTGPEPEPPTRLS